MNEILNIINNAALEYKQKRQQLAIQAENMLPYVNISKKSANYLSSRVICDIFEGNAPYRPRYILPDYGIFMRNGSDYLDLEPPKNMYEAINALLIIYGYVPSITGYPVYLGQVDELLEPFTHTVSRQELYNLLKMYLINIDRLMPDAFVHMNIGPKRTIVGSIILQLEKELKKAVPNISFKFSHETPDDFAIEVIDTALEVGKPYFVNDAELKGLYKSGYGIASCYNTLPIGGGSYTLVRLNLAKAASLASDHEDFFNNILPDVIEALCEIINARTKYLVENAIFFQSSFLVREGLINIENFTAMAGVFGLYECVETLTSGLKMGQDEKADIIANEIIQRSFQLIKSCDGSYCYATNGKIGFHAQSGIDTDKEETAGVRIKVGNEPEIFKQIKLESELHKNFDTGVSDIYIFDKTAKSNMEGVLKIIKGAMKNGLKVFALNTSDSELIRITGYLVKKSDLEKYNANVPLKEGTVKLGAETIKSCRVAERKVRKFDESNS